MMQSIRFVLLIPVLSLIGTQPAIAFETPTAQPVQDHPNVVMFFIDDLGYMDLSCYGSSFHETPVIDGLAKRSVRFTDFYSANPVCSPTRAALMTGKAPQRIGITQWLNQPNELHLPLDEVTIGEAFSSVGYKTGYIGKWHLGDKDDYQPSQQGFTWMRCVNRAGQPGSYFFPYKRKGSSRKQIKIPYSDVPDLDDGKEGDYLTDGLTDQALSFISDNKNRPFFLCFAHYAVHTPIQAPAELVEQYRPKAKKIPADGPEYVAERNNSRTRPIQNNPTYAAMMDNLDKNVGRVLKRLDELSLTDNTIIVFTSDNGGLSTLAARRGAGGPTSCLPLRAGKGWTYEGGIRIPTMISWPGKVKPAVSSTPAITMDLYPTLLELAGLKLRPNQHLDGHSLVSALKGAPDETLMNRFLAWTYPHNHGSGHTPSNAIRSGNWKLIQLTDEHTKTEDRYELYDLSNDIGEQENLSIKHHDKTHQLAKFLSEWIEETTPVGEQKQ